MTGTDRPAEQSKQRSPNEDAVPNRRSVVDSPECANCRPYGKANPSADKRMTWVAIGHPGC